MPELNPRRVPPTKARFAQVTAAVLSGMAAMFCIQNVIEFRREAARPAAPAAAASPEPAPPPPDIDLPAGVRRQAGPAPSSMMLKPEPGLSAAPVSVVGVSGEEAPPKYTPPAAPPPPKAKKKEMPRLQDRTMESPFASNAVRNDGRFSRIKRMAPKEEPPEAPAPAAPPPEPVAGASAMAVIERPGEEPEHLKPAPIAQITVPEVVFWTKERKLQVGAALVVMVLGVLYLVYATGIKDAPARAEGEL